MAQPAHQPVQGQGHGRGRDLGPLRHRFDARVHRVPRRPRDAWKLEHWDDYARGIDTATSPPSVHLTIDNRQGAAISIADQTREALRKILG